MNRIFQNSLLARVRRALVPALAGAWLGFSPQQAQAVPASPDPVVVKQPDGTKLQVFIRGDEWFHWLQTPAGAVVVQDAKTKAYVYAQPVAGGGIAATTRKAGTGLASAHFKPVAPAGVSAMRNQAARVAVPRAITTNGTANVLTILVTYSDVNNSIPASYFNNMLFGAGTGTMKSLYTEMSRGAFTVAAGPAGVVGWYRAPGTHDSYGGTFPLGAQLVKDVVQIADAAGVNFDPYDQDNDGFVDVVNIVHQGNGEETSGDESDVWSHRWDLNSAGVGSVVTNDGVTVNDYIMSPETVGGVQNTVGVFAHEYGHALGLPDLYDTDGSSAGIGNWSLMAGGSYNSVGGNPSGSSPAHMDAWSKIKMGWISPTVVTTNRLGLSIPAVETSGTVFKFRDASFGANEYFLIENRQPIGFDAGLDGFGLAIWHVDDGVPAFSNEFNANEWYPGNTSSGHYGIALEQSDGYFDLERDFDRGDETDLWPGGLNRTTFNQNTEPNSRSYAGGATPVAIKNISASGATMTADIILAANSNTVTLVSPAEGANVSGNVALSATTSNNTAFSRLDFAYRAPAPQLSRTPGIDILDNTVVTDTATLSVAGTVSSASLAVDITHTYIGDLIVVLIAPDGTRTTVHNATGTSDDDLVQSYDLTSVLAGKTLSGNWSLEVKDKAGGDEGVLNNWSLTFNDSVWTAIGADTNGADGTGRWTATWNTSGRSLGAYEVRVLGTATDGDTSEDKNAVTVTATASNQAPVSVSASPSSGTSNSSVSRTLSVVYRDGNGASDISQARVLVNSGANAANGLYGLYDAVANRLYLYNDAGSTITGGFAPGSANTISNAQGTLNCAQTSVVKSGNTLTVNWSFTPNGFFAGSKNIYGWVRDAAGATEALKALGSWTIALSSGNDTPLVQSLNPTSGTSNSSTAQTFSMTYSDPDGVANIAQVRVLINASQSGAGALYGLYDVAPNRLYVFNEAGTAVTGGLVLGTNASISTAQGTLNCAATTVIKSGNTLTVNWNWTPNGFFVGSKQIFGWVRDAAGAHDGFRALGTWAIAANAGNDAPVNRSLSPASTNSTVGVAKTFSATYGDPDGATDISRARILINSNLMPSGALYGVFDRAANKLYLYANDGTTLLGGFAPGSANTISNSQGTLNCAATTVSQSGNLLTVNWSFTPSASFAGAKKLHLLVADAANASDGWDAMGTWNISAAMLGAPAKATAKTSAGQS